ncbi:MAG TPA: rod shape-determining protein MreC [Candidatus Paceibacterota bacterium]|nr:rod shape-determining protein MreC [Candidatus Paceibacterota bacterium]
MVRKPRILLAVILVAAVAAGDLLLAHGRIGQWVADRSGPLMQPVVAVVGRTRLWTATVWSRTDLIAENLRLQDEIERLRAAVAESDALHAELVFTRAAAGIRERLAADPIAAGIFSWHHEGAAVLATINRGSAEGIAANDVVITANGSLIGVVRDVYARHATITVLGDPTLQAAGRIMGTNISGLVRAGEDGLILDLVKKDEVVTEGDIVITGGNDRFPGGLVIGEVRSVDAQQPTLFSVVHVRPMVDQPLVGFVLVLKM